MLKGSCCCGDVRFELADKPTLMAKCHCIRCRKVGASTFVLVRRDDFMLVGGGSAITTYPPEDGYLYSRDFCSRCGSALGEITGTAASFPIPANCFDDELDMEVQFHEFVSEKPKWSIICDSVRQFEMHPHEV